MNRRKMVGLEKGENIIKTEREINLGI